MSANTELVILVDEKDNPLGTMEKMEAHKKSLLHRAFSVLLFNGKHELLLQKRAVNKYHCGGLWTNTCCSHPHPGENIEKAAVRRLKEEMGIECKLKKVFHFLYKAAFDNGLAEHEFDHVFFGEFSGEPIIDTTEVADWKYMPLDALKKDMATNPNLYTPWFKIIIQKMETQGPL